MTGDARMRLHVPDRADAWLAGAAAVLVSIMLSWRPSFWFDEAATIAAANRSEIDILRLVLNFDAVHALYYLAMHSWLCLAPINEFTARLPSAVAVGAAAAGLIVLGKMVADRPTAWAGAAAFTVLPRTLWAAVEARSYALTAALAVWLTVVLVIAATRRGSALWALYGLTLALAVVSFVYLALLVFAHAVTLAVERKWRQLVPFAIAAAAGLGLVSPLVALASGQRQHQLWWIGGGGYLTGVLWEQWLTGSRLFMGASVIVLLWGSVLLVRRRAAGAASALAVALPWVLIPTTALIGYSVLVDDVYQPRYLTYTAPGFGLLLGVCVAAIARDRARILAVSLAVLAVSAGTAFLTQRSAYGKPGGADYSAVAQVISANARPRDCVSFGYAQHEPLRAVAAARPDAFAGLDDVAAGVSGAYAAQLWTQDLPFDSDPVRSRLAACRVLWAIIDSLTPSPIVNEAERQGFTVDQTWKLNRSIVIRLKRS
ncbi:MAG: mannosyltransferase [Mycobacterium sp.]|uniref:glycosyltransferase family 39 protein n=1 Tax=Mycobacterium sp. TaxID=1785 RepID=UPI003CC54E04